MSKEILKAKTLKSAIASLPDAKLYPVNTIRIRVDKIDVIFEKLENEWYLKN